MCLFVCPDMSKVRHREFIFEAGSNSMIECEMSSQLSINRWDLSCPSQGHGVPQIIHFFNGNKIRSDFADSFDVQSVNRSDQWTSVVTLLNIRPHHAGLYKCMDAHDDLTKMDQRVSIIGEKSVIAFTQQQLPIAEG